MGRLHSNGKGISASAVPYSRSAPSWLKTTPDQVVDQICKLAKKGATPSQIGVILRDSHGVAQVKVVTDSANPQVQRYGSPSLRNPIINAIHPTSDRTIERTTNPLHCDAMPSATQTRLKLGAHGTTSGRLAPDIPEDLYMLIKKAVAVRKHLERNRKDKDSKFRLILIESRIHRLARYYKTVGVLPPTWRYEAATASTLVA
ncbi:hypothetical protein N8I77_003416 [Diaporthe amygdali]|uniref:Small ribosomal subunit protein uS15 N-terminal domain-containing protein n=1 Tax=Phomopsis amygdali TaxID=1214568 RepID=A0AAD9SJX0_PHOAM|nr:hypothetical protein N8I77_003416 [Diaporthe amygdali]